MIPNVHYIKYVMLLMMVIKGNKVKTLLLEFIGLSGR